MLMRRSVVHDARGGAAMRLPIVGVLHVAFLFPSLSNSDLLFLDVVVV